MKKEYVRGYVRIEPQNIREMETPVVVKINDEDYKKGDKMKIKDLSTDELLDLFKIISQRKDVKWIDAKIHFKDGREIGFDSDG